MEVGKGVGMRNGGAVGGEGWGGGLEEVQRGAGGEDAGEQELPVLRGGAALLHPWEDEGEWHFLLNAHRHNEDAFASSLALRPVVSVSEILK